MPFTIAIVGRPNVGKSSLFNKLVGRKVAIVNDYAGVTRDRKIETGHLGGMEFDVVDTAGLEYNLTDKQLLADGILLSTTSIDETRVFPAGTVIEVYGK